MITGTLVALALVLGYAVATGLLLATTFGIAAARPEWVTREHRLTGRYKLIQAMLWLICVTAGAYVTATVAGSVDGWIVGVTLTAMLTGVLWASVWEAQQRGMPLQIALNIAVVTGVSAGYALRVS
jgi:hypothetical protein